MDKPTSQLDPKSLAALRDIVRAEFHRAQPDAANAEARADKLTEMLGEQIARKAMFKPSLPPPRDSYRISNIVDL